jgi:hypothetical protein
LIEQRDNLRFQISLLFGSFNDSGIRYDQCCSTGTPIYHGKPAIRILNPNFLRPRSTISNGSNGSKADIGVETSATVFPALSRDLLSLQRER